MSNIEILLDKDYIHEIYLVDSKTPPFSPLYPLSAAELEVLRNYLEEILGKSFIRSSSSPAGALVLFIKKVDSSLRLYVDYRELNRITKKNRYPLPRINKMLNRLVSLKVFTKFNLRDAYHRIRIRRGDEWKTVFMTRYGYFKYLIIPFGLYNTPITFQSYINKVISRIFNLYYIIYLNNILIFSKTNKEYIGYIKEVLRRLE